MDNWTQVNKISTCMVIQSFLMWNILGESHELLLRIRYTHKDIDHTFSCTSRRLGTSNAIKLAEIDQELCV